MTANAIPLPETTDLAMLLDRATTLTRQSDWVGGRRAALFILARCRNHTAALALLGECEMNLGRPARARFPLSRCVRLGGQFVHRLLYAACLRSCGDAAAAVHQRELAAQSIPATWVAYFLLGDACERDGDHERARELFEHALRLDPARALVSHRLGCCLVTMGDPTEACAPLRDACAGEMTNAAFHIDYSSALAGCGRFEEARLEAETAVLLAPHHPVAHHNLGHALLNLNRSREAIAAFDEALRILPDEPRTRFSRATALLKDGQFEEGWREYEYRWKDCQVPRTDIPAPLWRGEDLRGKVILLHGEQGYGDSLQFVRFAKILADRQAHVVVQVGLPLVRLFEAVAGVERVFSVLPAELDLDFHLPMASLPFRVGLLPNSIPGAPYLVVADEEIIRQGGAVRQHMTAGSGARPALVVGLVWAGDARKGQSRATLVDRRRSMSLHDLAPLFDLPGVRFCSFQLGEAAMQISESGLPVVDVTEGIRDFADTGARLFGVDLLVSVDTSIVHLAGGLGRPVWMLSRFDGCWRWLEGCHETSWYPSMHIFRQNAPGDWDSAVRALRDRLARWAAAYWEQPVETPVESLN